MTALLNLLRSFYSLCEIFQLWIVKHLRVFRVAFLFSIIVTTIKASVRLFGFLYNTFSSIIQQVSETAGQIADTASSVGMPIFDKVNAIFPVVETFAFFAAYGGFVLALTIWKTIVHIYKLIPLKAT